MERGVILVDDEAIIVLALARELAAALGPGFRVETALNAREALELADELDEEGCGVGVVVSDWLMPGMKGDELLVIMRMRYADAVLIMITGQAEDEAVERAVSKAGILACVRKPWRSAELVALVKAAAAG